MRVEGVGYMGNLGPPYQWRWDQQSLGLRDHNDPVRVLVVKVF